MAGNLPFYHLSSEKTDFNFIESGTEIPCSFGKDSSTFLAPGEMSPGGAYSGPGFPIGFDFRIGGKNVDSFVLTSNGYIFFGKEKIEYDGLNSFFFNGYGASQSQFYAACAPIVSGTNGSDGKISYLTTGEPGTRVLTIEYRNLTLNESGRDKGKYSMQVKCYEEDGKMEFLLKEEETTYSTLCGFVMGIRGWDVDDVVLGTAAGLAKDFTKSPSTVYSMLQGDTFVKWDSKDFIKLKTVKYTFLPDSNTEAPAEAPKSLELMQEESNLIVKVEKGQDSEGLMLLMSDQPFTEADHPVDGVTYPSGMSDVPAAAIGNAKVLFHNQNDLTEVTIPDLKPGAHIYLRAISTSGYPAYNCENVLDKEFVIAQAAPTYLAVNPVADSQNAVEVECQAAEDIIIAKTLEAYMYYLDEDYNIGAFGQPSADAEIGDMIEGGGEVVYVGEPGKMILGEIQPNRPTFFRAWTVKDGLVSPTNINAHFLPEPSMPYEPMAELWPSGHRPEGWDNEGRSSFTPGVREGDGVYALEGMNGGTAPSVICTPVLPAKGKTEISFNWSMESQLAQDGGATEAGKFGLDGYFTVSYGFPGQEKEYWRTNEYNGEMPADEQGRIHSGSTTLLPVKIEVPEAEDGMRLRFEYIGESGYFTTMYLTEISVKDGSSVAIEAVYPDASQVEIKACKGGLEVTAANDTAVEIFSIDGKLICRVDLKAGESKFITLTAGVYIANRNKFIIK